MDSDLSWILFTYRIASEPSTVRVRAWRILRRIGALALQQSACIVPSTPLVVRKLEQLQSVIQESGGDAHWIDIERLAPQTEMELIERFNRERAEEYASLAEDCEALMTVESSPVADLELKQLQKSYRKLHERDYFNCPEADLARTMLRDAVNHFRLHMEQTRT